MSCTVFNELHSIVKKSQISIKNFSVLFTFWKNFYTVLTYAEQELKCIRTYTANDCRKNRRQKHNEKDGLQSAANTKNKHHFLLIMIRRVSTDTKKSFNICFGVATSPPPKKKDFVKHAQQVKNFIFTKIFTVFYKSLFP